MLRESCLLLSWVQGLRSLALGQLPAQLPSLLCALVVPHQAPALSLASSPLPHCLPAGGLSDRLRRITKEVATLPGQLPLSWESAVLAAMDEDNMGVLRWVGGGAGHAEP